MANSHLNALSPRGPHATSRTARDQYTTGEGTDATMYSTSLSFLYPDRPQLLK
jgi:hypothetical protein